MAAAALAGLMLGGRRLMAAGARAEPLRFGLITDIHYGDALPRDRRYFRESLAKAREAVACFRDERARFVAELGDLLKDTPPADHESQARSLAELEAIERELQRFGGPVYHVLGNHDLDNLSKAQVLAHLTNAGVPPGQSHYGFAQGGIRFLVLDEEFRHDGRPYDHGNYDWREYNVPPPELEWLRRELASDAGPVIVLTHQPLDGREVPARDNRSEVRAVLEESGQVLAVFQGHHHPGGYSFINGIHYYTLIAAVEGSGPENNAYAIVEGHADRGLTVHGFRRAVSMDLPAHAPGRRI